jgi:methyltransferase
VAWPAIILLLFVAAQRLAELVLDRINTTALLAKGGMEFGARHYPLFIVLHSSWLLSLIAWTLLFTPQVNWVLFVIYGLLQAGRIWVLRTLGPYWTTRIISIPTAPLVTTGPYRYIKHPNYWIVVCEIALLPLVLGAWQISIVFSLLNAALLFHRIRIENRVLASRR